VGLYKLMAEWNWTVAEHCGRWEGLSAWS